MSDARSNIFILIVEPEAGKMDSVYTTLFSHGYQFGFAQNKEDAVKILTADLYSFVVTEYSFTDRSAVEFQRKLELSGSKARIIFTYPMTAGRPVDHGGCLWLGEPFGADELMTLLG